MAIRTPNLVECRPVDQKNVSFRVMRLRGNPCGRLGERPDVNDGRITCVSVVVWNRCVSWSMYWTTALFSVEPPSVQFQLVERSEKSSAVFSASW